MVKNNIKVQDKLFQRNINYGTILYQTKPNLGLPNSKRKHLSEDEKMRPRRVTLQM